MELKPILKIRFSTRMLAVLLSAVVALSVGSAFAQATVSVNPEQQMNERFDKIFNFKPDPDNDVIQRSFRFIFGDFIYAPFGGVSGTSGQIGNVTVLSQILGWTNVLAYFIGVVILSYIFIGGAVKTAYEGTVLGKRWNTPWLVIRTTLGFGLIMPFPGIGAGVFSAVQVIIIYLILVGANAGNVLWARAVDNVAGMSLVIGPESMVDMRVPRNILAMWVCAQSSRENDPTESNRTLVRLLEGEPSYEAVEKVLSWVGWSKVIDTVRKDINDFNIGLINAHYDRINRIEFGEAGDCGFITLHKGEVASSRDASYHDVAFRTGLAEGKRQLLNMVEQMRTIAIKILSDAYLKGGENINYVQASGSPEQREAIDQVAAEYALRAAEYTENINQVIFEKVYTKPLAGGKNFAELWRTQIKDGGFGKAGMVFHELSRFPAIRSGIVESLQSAVSDVNLPQFCGDGAEDACFEKERQFALDMEGVKLIHARSLKLMQDASESRDNGGSSLLPAKLYRAAWVESARGWCVADGLCSNQAKDPEVVMKQASGMVGANLSAQAINFAEWIGEDDTGLASAVGGMQNPFSAVSAIGHGVNQIAIAVIATAATMAAAGEVAKKIPTGVKAIGGVGGMAISAIGNLAGKAIGLIMALALILLPIGLTLAYLVPMLPVIVWIMLIISYLITCVEAVVAAPLSVILLVTPEGEGISGSRQERALALVAMTILRPSLLIIGLITMMTLSYVAFDIMHEMFFGTAGDIASHREGVSGNILQRMVGGLVDGAKGILEGISLLVIYTMMAWQITKLLTSIMHRLADQILEWFTGNVARQFGENDIGDVVSRGTGAMEAKIGQFVGQPQGMLRYISDRK